jgi:hypothetical protein
LETEARFGWRPFPEQAKEGDLTDVLRARRNRPGLMEGEDLIIDAMFSDPRTATAAPSGPATVCQT